MAVVIPFNMAAFFMKASGNFRALVSTQSRLQACERCRRLYAMRFCSGTSRDGDDGAELETFEGPVPREKLSVSFSKSSGPGGQNVNKLNTKAEVRFHVDSADWLPQRVKDRLHTMFKSRVTKEGELIVISQEHRTQHRNLDAAVGKLEGMLHEASEVPRGPSELTLARIRTLKKKAQHRKRVEKKYLSIKKQERRQSDY